MITTSLLKDIMNAYVFGKVMFYNVKYGFLVYKRHPFAL